MTGEKAIATGKTGATSSGPTSNGKTTTPRTNILDEGTELDQPRETVAKII